MNNSKEGNRKHEHDAYSEQDIFPNDTRHYSRVEKNKANSGITYVRSIFLLLLLSPFRHL